MVSPGTRLCVVLFCMAGAVAGCGKVDNTSPADAGIDADLSGAVTIVTEAALFGGAVGSKVGSIDVISSARDSTVFAAGRTDAGGNLMINVVPGGSVTAIYKHTVDMGADLITWVGVKPGDTLTFGNRNFSTTNQTAMSLGTQAYTWPAFAGASFYSIATSCAPSGFIVSGTTTSIPENPSCHHEPMDIVYLALNSSFAVLSVGILTNVPFSNGATATLGAWAAPKSAMITITGLPPEITTVAGSFRPVIDTTTTVFSPGNAYSGTPTGGGYTQPFNWVPAGDRTVGAVVLGRPGFASMQLLDSFSPTTLTQTVASPPLPAWVQGRTAASSALRSATWYQVPEPAAVTTGQLLHLTWNHTNAGMPQPHQWDVILPPDVSSIELPVLPSQFNDNQPAPQDVLFALTRVFGIPAVTGYDALRALPSSNVMCLECAVATGDFSRVVFSAL